MSFVSYSPVELGLISIALVIAANAPKHGPLLRATAFDVIACASGVVIAFNPTAEDAGVDLASFPRDLFERVMQGRFLVADFRRHVIRIMGAFGSLDEIGNAPIPVFHDGGSGFEKGRQLLTFRLFRLGGLDAGSRVAEVGKPLLGDPQDALPNEVIPMLERGEPVRCGARLTGGDEPAQEREPGRDKGVALLPAVVERVELEASAFGGIGLSVNACRQDGAGRDRPWAGSCCLKSRLGRSS